MRTCVYMCTLDEMVLNDYIFCMDSQKIFQNKTQFLALTTLYLIEFEELLPYFSNRWHQFIKHFNFRRKRRTKPLTGTQIQNATKQLKTDEEKLFFILYFFKNAHLQQSLAAQFDMDQGQVSRWIKILMPLLEKSIIDLHLQPARSMSELVKLFRNRQMEDNLSNCESAESLHLDATERLIQRNVDYKAQEQDYSGKKGTHTVKNSVLNDENQFIHFIGLTFPGPTSDKVMADWEIPDFSMLQKWQLWFTKDKGYQGYQPNGVHFLEPFKAAKNKPLTDIQKEYNSWFSSIRIVGEHVMSGIKRCRLVKDELRYFSSTFRDKIFFIASGLHNFRVTRRKNTYNQGALRIRARFNLNFSDT